MAKRRMRQRSVHLAFLLASFAFSSSAFFEGDRRIARDSTRIACAARHHRSLGGELRKLRLNDSTSTTLAIARGGATDVSVTDEDADGLQAMRRFIKALLNLSERVSPGLSKTLKGFVRLVEDVFGVELVPKKLKTLKRKKGSKDTMHSGVEKSTTKEHAAVTSGTPARKAAKSDKSAAPKSKVHVTKDLKSTSPNYRIQQELKKFLADPPPNLSVSVGKNLRVWIVTMKGAKDTVYQGETFRLRISFPAAYPTVPPSVYFLPPNIPVHEHVYTNGDICLSLLGKDWRPTMTAQSIAVSILSILSSAQSKSLPMDNAQHSHRKPGQYQENWVYHDDNC